MFFLELCLKGELKWFFYLLKVLIGPKLRQVSIAIFHQKAPKWIKNQVKGSKIDQIRIKWHPTCWGHPPILSSELLRESINSVIRPTEGIHLLTISASDLLRESTDSVLRATEGIHQFCHLTYWGNPLYNSLSRSDDGIDGFPQQLWGQNRWIPSAALRTPGSYLVNFGPFDLIFDPPWGFSVKNA